MPIATVAEYKTYAGVSGTEHDARLADVLSMAQAWMERRCGRSFDLASYTDEEYDGTGGPTLVLRNAPVTLLTSVSIRGDSGEVTTVGPGTYRLDAGGGRVIRLASIETVFGEWRGADPVWPRGSMNVLVTYTAGYSTAPPDLKRALFRVMDRMWHEGRSDPSVSSESIGAYSRSMRAGHDVRDEIEAMLLPFRRNVA